MFTDVSMVTSAPRRISIRVNRGSSKGPRELRRGDFTVTATGSSPSRNLGDIDVVHGRVVQRHFADEVAGHRRVAVRAVEDQRGAGRPPRGRRRPGAGLRGGT